MQKIVTSEHGLSVKEKFFLYLATFHTALLVASNAGGAKIISLPFGMSASATVFSYMATFVVLDVVSELYGKKASKLVIHLGLCALVISVAFFQLSIIAPADEVWLGQQGYEQTLGSSLRILIGGWTSYMVSQHIDVWSFFRLKSASATGKHLWIRAIGSTLVGQLVDTVIFITVAFYGVFPVLPTIMGQYVIKIILAAISLPLVYLGVKFGQRVVADDR